MTLMTSQKCFIRHWPTLVTEWEELHRECTTGVWGALLEQGNHNPSKSTNKRVPMKLKCMLTDVAINVLTLLFSK